jgi:hypothetical protein
MKKMPVRVWNLRVVRKNPSDEGLTRFLARVYKEK